MCQGDSVRTVTCQTLNVVADMSSTKQANFFPPTCIIRRSGIAGIAEWLSRRPHVITSRWIENSAFLPLPLRDIGLRQSGTDHDGVVDNLHHDPKSKNYTLFLSTLPLPTPRKTEWPATLRFANTLGKALFQFATIMASGKLSVDTLHKVLQHN